MRRDFEHEELTDEEIENQLSNVDSTILEIAKKIEEDEKNHIGIINPIKYQQIQFAYNTILTLTKGQNVKVSYKLNKPFKSMGSVTVEGRYIEFKNIEWFARAAEFATNTEIYPKLNGNVVITFTFHGLVRNIE